MESDMLYWNSTSQRGLPTTGAPELFFHGEQQASDYFRDDSDSIRKESLKFYLLDDSPCLNSIMG